MFTGRVHGRHFGHPCSPAVLVSSISQALTRAIFTGVQNDARIHGPQIRIVCTELYKTLCCCYSYNRPSTFLNKCSAVAEMGDRLATIDMDRKLGLCPLWWEPGYPCKCNTMWPGPRPTFVPSGILIHPPVWPQQTWAKNWGALPLGGRWSCVRIKHNVARAEAYLRTKWHLDPSSRWAIIEMGRKLGDCVPFGRGPVSPSNTVSFRPMPTSLPSGVLIHPAIWRQHMGRKLWGLCSF